MHEEHPVRFSVEYPDRPLDRLTSAFRIFTVIPIAIVLFALMSDRYPSTDERQWVDRSATPL